MRIVFIILSLVCVSAFGVTPAEFNKIRSLAEKDDPESQYELAEFYNWGGLAENYNWGMYGARDQDEAVKLYFKAAKQGHEKAQIKIAGLYFYGRDGLPMNYEEGFNWYRKAAEQGSVEALEMVGICCQWGVGVPVNQVEAYAYFNVGGAIDNRCSEFRDKLAKKMTPSQIEAGQKRSLELQAKIDSRKASKEKKR